MIDTRKSAEPGFAGRLNIYTCDTCRGHIVTRDMAEGVTPFMIECRAAKKCAGMMQSSMYRVFDQHMKEDYQWRKPASVDELAALNKWEAEHVAKGGLILYPTPETAAERMARTGFTPGVHGEVLERFNAQLLIVMAKQLRARGHNLRFPITEVNDTGLDMLAFQIVDGEFRFELQRKG